MANQRRSIWESRFYALRERINQKREALIHKSARLSLSGKLELEDRENLKNRIAVLDELSEDGYRIAQQRGTIFLLRDM